MRSILPRKAFEGLAPVLRPIVFIANESIWKSLSQRYPDVKVKCEWTLSGDNENGLEVNGVPVDVHSAARLWGMTGFNPRPPYGERRQAFPGHLAGALTPT